MSTPAPQSITVPRSGCWRRIVPSRRVDSARTARPTRSRAPAICCVASANTSSIRSGTRVLQGRRLNGDRDAHTRVARDDRSAWGDCEITRPVGYRADSTRFTLPRTRPLLPTRACFASHRRLRGLCRRRVTSRSAGCTVPRPVNVTVRGRCHAWTCRVGRLRGYGELALPDGFVRPGFGSWSMDTADVRRPSTPRVVRPRRRGSRQPKISGRLCVGTAAHPGLRIRAPG